MPESTPVSTSGLTRWRGRRGTPRRSHRRAARGPARGRDVEGTGVQHASAGVAQQLSPDRHLEPGPAEEARPAPGHLGLQPVRVRARAGRPAPCPPPRRSRRPYRQRAAHPVVGVLLLGESGDEDAGVVNRRGPDRPGEPDLQPLDDPLGEFGPRDPSRQPRSIQSCQEISCTRGSPTSQPFTSS